MLPRVPVFNFAAATLALALSWAVSPAAAQAEPPAKKFVVVCSTTQIADFARQIGGDRWEVVCVLAPGQDPHLYQIKPDDTRTVQRADLCLENGWHLEGKEWMRTLATDAGKPLVTCIEGVSPLELEADGETVPDPHAWFSPKNAAVYVRNITHGMAEIDAPHAAEYQARAELYLAQLRTLDAWIQRQVNAVPASRRVLVTSHDAFNYFCAAYGFRSAAPVGWSTGEEAGGGITPQRQQETIDSIRSFGVPAIFVETSVNPKMVEEIAKAAGVRVGGELYSDSMGPAGSAGETYLGMMRENVLRIVSALQ